MLPSRTFCFSLWVRSGLIFTGQRVIQRSSQVAEQFTGFAQEGKRWSRDPTVKTCSKKLSNFLDHFQQALVETKQTHHKNFVKFCEDVKTKCVKATTQCLVNINILLCWGLQGNVSAINKYFTVACINNGRGKYISKCVSHWLKLENMSPYLNITLIPSCQRCSRWSRSASLANLWRHRQTHNSSENS